MAHGNLRIDARAVAVYTVGMVRWLAIPALGAAEFPPARIPLVSRPTAPRCQGSRTPALADKGTTCSGTLSGACRILDRDFDGDYALDSAGVAVRPARGARTGRARAAVSRVHSADGTLSGACRILDLDFDGDYDSADATLFDALPQGLARHPGLLATALDFPFAHQGLYYDPELGSYQNRHRQYDPKLRRFMQRDPVGYVDGLNLYIALRCAPCTLTDALALACDYSQALFIAEDTIEDDEGLWEAECFGKNCCCSHENCAGCDCHPMYTGINSLEQLIRLIREVAKQNNGPLDEIHISGHTNPPGGGIYLSKEDVMELFHLARLTKKQIEDIQAALKPGGRYDSTDASPTTLRFLAGTSSRRRC